MSHCASHCHGRRWALSPGQLRMAVPVYARPEPGPADGVESDVGQPKGPNHMRCSPVVRAFSLVVVSSLAVAAVASADKVGSIDFEAPAYHTGNIDGQQGWQKSGAYDVAVASVANYPAAAKYGFG